MADTSDVLLKMLEEQWAQARQSEEQRATLTNYIIAITAAVLAFVVAHGITKQVWPLTGLLVLLGIYGAVASGKLYERFNLHVHRVGKIMRRLDELHPDAEIRARQKLADSEHKADFPRLTKLRLNWLWLALNLLIALIGMITTGISLAGPEAPRETFGKPTAVSMPVSGVLRAVESPHSLSQEVPSEQPSTR